MAKIGESTAADSDLASHLMKANQPGAPNPLTMEEVVVFSSSCDPVSLIFVRT